MVQNLLYISRCLRRIGGGGGGGGGGDGAEHGALYYRPSQHACDFCI